MICVIVSQLLSLKHSPNNTSVHWTLHSVSSTLAVFYIITLYESMFTARYLYYTSPPCMPRSILSSVLAVYVRVAASSVWGQDKAECTGDVVMSSLFDLSQVLLSALLSAAWSVVETTEAHLRHDDFRSSVFSLSEKLFGLKSVCEVIWNTQWMMVTVWFHLFEFISLCTWKKCSDLF